MKIIKSLLNAILIIALSTAISVTAAATDEILTPPNNSDNTCNGECIDSPGDTDHLCDNGCGAIVEDCIPNADDNDCTTAITCSICQKVLTEGAETHTGGIATYTEKAICEVCSTPYGNVLTHEYGSEFKFDELNHWNECTCSDKANVAPHKDEDGNTICDVCEYVMITNDPSAPTPDLPEPSTPLTNETETEKKNNSNKETESEIKIGCTSSASLSALTIVSLFGAALLIKKK